MADQDDIEVLIVTNQRHRVLSKISKLVRDMFNNFGESAIDINIQLNLVKVELGTIPPTVDSCFKLRELEDTINNVSDALCQLKSDSPVERAIGAMRAMKAMSPYDHHAVGAILAVPCNILLFIGGDGADVEMVVGDLLNEQRLKYFLPDIKETQEEIESNTQMLGMLGTDMQEKMEQMELALNMWFGSGLKDGGLKLMSKLKACIKNAIPKASRVEEIDEVLQMLRAYAAISIYWIAVLQLAENIFSESKIFPKFTKKISGHKESTIADGRGFLEFLILPKQMEAHIVARFYLNKEPVLKAFMGTVGISTNMSWINAFYRNDFYLMLKEAGVFAQPLIRSESCTCRIKEDAVFLKQRGDHAVWRIIKTADGDKEYYCVPTSRYSCTNVTPTDVMVSTHGYGPCILHWTSVRHAAARRCSIL